MPSSLRNSLATLVGLTLAAAVLVLAPVSQAAAQDQEEAIAYHGWFAAPPRTRGGDPIDMYEGWSRHVEVSRVNPATLASSRHSAAPPCGTSVAIVQSCRYVAR